MKKDIEKLTAAIIENGDNTEYIKTVIEEIENKKEIRIKVYDITNEDQLIDLAEIGILKDCTSWYLRAVIDFHKGDLKDFYKMFDIIGLINEGLIESAIVDHDRYIYYIVKEVV